ARLCLVAGPARSRIWESTCTSRRWSWRRTRWFFFFQAEDGIRDLIVTGVQTCALPISFISFNFPSGLVLYWLVNNLLSMAQQWRSEERRVGKECRSRGSPHA